MIRSLLVFAMFVTGGALNAHAETEVVLPDQQGTKPAITHAPFPSRMHAFVFRNWTVVPKNRLAEVLQTTDQRVEEVARSMGLPEQSEIDDRWQTKGYITVLRRNWHLLPYDQLTMLLGMSREKLRDALLEDDFLMVKLGNLKPACEPLLYHAPTNSQASEAAQIASWLTQQGVGDFDIDEEPRFAFISELSKLASDPTPNHPTAAANADSSFGLRMIFSYFADFGDPLIDPEVRSYPEGLLQRLSASGVNAVWVHGVLRTLAKDPAFPEFGVGCEQRIAGLRKLVERGKKHGIDVYLYMNEPRTMPSAFFDAKEQRQSMRGVATREQVRLCTSHPEVRRWMSDALASVFTQVPGLGGIFTITASENPTSCASHRQQASCPHCQDRSYAEIIAEVNSTLAQGVARGNPDAKTICWDWGWDDAQAAEIIKRLPKDCLFMSVSEWALPIQRGGVASTVGEYSLSSVGPGPRATRHWQLAREAGLRTVAKVQTSASWEFCVIPYLPVMNLVAQHAKNLSSAGVDGVMLSWSLGSYPSPNLEIFQAFHSHSSDVDDVLRRIAEQRYGRAAAATALAAWNAFSDGFRQYPYHIGTVYQGPQHVGPANPVFLEPTGYRATMVGIPYDDLKSWRSIYPANVWIEQMQKVQQGFARGCEGYEQLVSETTGEVQMLARRELGLFRAAELHFASCANQARLIRARDEMLSSTSEAEVRGYRTEIRRLLAEEMSLAKQLLHLVQADSRIGYEASNHYFYIPQDLREKVLLCKYHLAALDQSDTEQTALDEQAALDEQSARAVRQ